MPPPLPSRRRRALVPPLPPTAVTEVIVTSSGSRPSMVFAMLARIEAFTASSTLSTLMPVN